MKLDLFSLPCLRDGPTFFLLGSRRKHCFSIGTRCLSSLSSSSIGTENLNSQNAGRTGGIMPSMIAQTPQKIDINPPKGTRDFPPEDMRLRSWLFQNFREVSHLFGFEEVDFPVLESEALFIRKAGEEIRDQLYCFEDRGNRRVALRPELTPSLARLVLQKGKSASLPLKWFAIGQCWRYERMTRGRRREHYQWNMDIIGVPEVMAEAELISAIVTFFKRLGITEADVGFKVSSRKVLQEVLRCYNLPEELFGRVCIVIDKLEKIPLDEIKKELKSIGMSDEAIKELLEVLSIKSLTKLEEKLGTSGQVVCEVKQLFAVAEKFGYSKWIQFDASIVRGLAYYTGIVFEGFDRKGKLRAICGGGRYDRLLSTFGGDDVPACGFGFGDAVIMELLKEKSLLPEIGLEVNNIICSLDPDLQGVAALVASTLRGKGQSVDLVLESKPMKWVFKRAARINAQRLILIGKSEWERSTVAVKILSTGEQYEVKLDELD
ncbi:histidine--tRNA ligase, chloroplastic/mitochondrial-like [Chenopodium quinoa]|nr:histidine--tRNA ligase, chloroplastic/mitochondrial-like [Chenopodium quinoa]